MRPHVRVLLLVGLLALVALGGCEVPGMGGEEPTPTPTQIASSVRLTFAGSTTVQPLAERLGQFYRLKHPNVVLEISAGGSRVGIQAIQEGTTDIGMASRDLREGEQTPGMERFQIAIDVLAIIVHPSNPVEQLSLEQLRGIYLGQITNWSEVGGPDMPIAPIIREVSSGTRGAFDEIVLEDETPIETPENTEITAGEVHTRVATSPDAIGYVGFGHLSGEEVKVLAIDGVEPSPEAATDGSYRLKRPLQLLLGPLSRPQARSFVEFALSDEGQQIVIEDGWVPVRSSAETTPSQPSPTTPITPIVPTQPITPIIPTEIITPPVPPEVPPYPAPPDYPAPGEPGYPAPAPQGDAAVPSPPSQQPAASAPAPQEAAVPAPAPQEAAVPAPAPAVPAPAAPAPAVPAPAAPAPAVPPTEEPTMPPTEEPTVPPTEEPTMPPTEEPTVPPTEGPASPILPLQSE